MAAKAVIELSTFLDRRISRRAFTHLLRLRIDGAGFRSGDAMNHFKQAEKIRDFVLSRFRALFFDFGGALVALAMCFYYDPVGRPCPGAHRARADPRVGKQFRDFDALVEKLLHLDRRAPERTGRDRERHRHRQGARPGKCAHAPMGRTTEDMLAKFRALRELYRSFNLRAQIAARGVTLLVLAVGCWRLFQGNLTVGELVALQLLSGRITFPLMASSDFYRSYKDVDVAIRQIAGFLAQPRERAAVNPPLRRSGPGGIRLSNVSLTYPGGAAPALDDVTLSLPERGMIALVGRNGSGKSTLIRILLGLRRDYAGTVEIGGRDLRTTIRAGCAAASASSIRIRCCSPARCGKTSPRRARWRNRRCARR